MREVVYCPRCEERARLVTTHYGTLVVCAECGYKYRVANDAL